MLHKVRHQEIKVLQLDAIFSLYLLNFAFLS